MDTKDAHKVIENLQTRPFICSENTIELDNGYVIVKKAYFKECQEARKKQIPKKPIHDGLYACPNCQTIMLQGAFEAKGRMWGGIGLERNSLNDINTRIEEEGQENNDTFRYIQNYGRLSL